MPQLCQDDGWILPTPRQLLEKKVSIVNMKYWESLHAPEGMYEKPHCPWPLAKTEEVSAGFPERPAGPKQMHNMNKTSL